MKIALFDSYNTKFTGDMIEWWQNNGHEVKMDRCYDPDLVDWADVVWFDTCDNNLKMACDPPESFIDDWKAEGHTFPWRLGDMDLSKKKIICRPIDIEVWGNHQANVDWNLIDDTIFIAEHIKGIANRTERLSDSSTKQHVIPCGVNLNKFTFKQHEPGYKIGVLSELWMSKGVDYGLQIAMKLKQVDPQYEIEWLGPNQMYPWEYEYCLDFIKRNDLNFKINHDHVPSIDEWLDSKNYLLHCSKKEGFSYATAEAMAKGIKPVLHHFYGAETLWPGMTWNTIDEAVGHLTDNRYDSHEYLQYLLDHGYTIDQMMTKIMEVING